MSAEKKQPQTQVTKAIRLKPSTTDYATFASTTAKVMGASAPRSKPNAYVLWLASAKS